MTRDRSRDIPDDVVEAEREAARVALAELNREARDFKVIWAQAKARFLHADEIVRSKSRAAGNRRSHAS